MSSKYSILYALLLFSAAALGVEPVFVVGQQVEAYDDGWYPGAVQEIGSGTHDGDFLIRFGASRARWFPGSRLRRIDDAAAAPETREGPRHGRYVLHNTGSGAPLALGVVDLLAGGRYRVWRHGQALLGEGLYRFDAAGGKVKWLTGPYAELRCDGRFLRDAEGSRHTIEIGKNLAASNVRR